MPQHSGVSEGWIMSCDMSHDLAALPPELGMDLVGRQPIPY